MVESSDISDLLNTGSWSRTRAKSPNPPAAKTQAPSRLDTPVRANQSSKLVSTVSGSYHLSAIRRYPPPPSVEDELVALAKEYGGAKYAGSMDEEPKFPGTADQEPVLLEIAQDKANDERRFTLYNATSGPPKEKENLSPKERLSRQPSRRGKNDTNVYEANTGRRYDGHLTADGPSKGPPPESVSHRRRSHHNLPPIDTGVLLGVGTAAVAASAAPALSRVRSATGTSDHRSRDYFEQREPSQIPGGAPLSPVIKHATNGRERAYWDMSKRQPAIDDTRGSPVEERRSNENWVTSTESSHSSARRKRASSTIEIPESARSHRDSEVHEPRGELQSPRLQRRPSSPGRAPRNSSPPRHSTNPRTSTLNLQRSSPPREEDELRANGGISRRPSERRRRPSVVTHEDRNGLLSPDISGRPPIGGRTRSRGTTPLASPRVTQESFPEYSDRQTPMSATYMHRSTDSDLSSNRYDDRGDYLSSSSRASPPRNRSRVGEQGSSTRPRAASRTPSVVQMQTPTSATLPIPIAIPMTASRSHNGVSERRRSPMPPSHNRQDSLQAHSPTSYRRSTSFDPSRSAAENGLPPRPRRFSDELRNGSLSNLPSCPRRRPSPGYSDWLTLPRCPNFYICPSCFDGTFHDPAYRQMFVLASSRTQDRPIACDFGTSPWYRIAYLMTRKYGYPDLRLMEGLAKVDAMNQPCPGPREDRRIWYSIKDPRTRHPLPDFNACYSCAKSVEVLLPNLVGVFSPVDSPAEASPGVCSMHYISGRKRFIEYFDLLESTSDRAQSRKTSPDVQSLANDVRQLSLEAECPRDEPAANQKWFIMKSMESFTVCEACFDEIVAPRIEDTRVSSSTGGTVAGNFGTRSVRIPEAVTCQLYSDRMREAFKKACKRNDLGYFIDKVTERARMQADIAAKIRKLQRSDEGDPWTREEIDKLYREYKQWE